jgi:proteasome lid subunit RPN8/RPN11
MIAIPVALLNEVYQHTESSYPHECCGLLIGTSENGTRTAHAFRKCRNLNTERAHDRYEMDPLCMLQVQREFGNTPWDIVGIYHSHPDHPSRPSQTDTDRAWPDYSYVIISVEKGAVANARSWVLNESGPARHFDQEEMVPVDEAAGTDGGKR